MNWKHIAIGLAVVVTISVVVATVPLHCPTGEVYRIMYVHHLLESLNRIRCLHKLECSQHHSWGHPYITTCHGCVPCVLRATSLL
ncbi:hypothetical protein BDR06DRAFT_795578 [Suillus hirtellus]|nr:hypothetical protein BDR06DRAFT_795578 [Suillus hirtellus]